MLDELPMPYRLIILMCLIWGMWGAGIYLLVKPDPETRLEILAEYKDSIVFDSKRERDIVFSTD